MDGSQVTLQTSMVTGFVSDVWVRVRVLPAADLDWAVIGSDHGFTSCCHTSHAHHDDGASNNWRRRSLEAADALGNRYLYPLAARVNGSNLHTARTVCINLSTRLRLVWRRGKTNINRLLGNASPGTRTTHGPAYCLPYELMEMIIGLITHDLDTLKAFSLTCRSWYVAPSPHPYSQGLCA